MYKVGKSSLSIMIAAAIGLTACQSQTTLKQVSTQPEAQTAIVKSPIDKREYASITLENGLEVVLVSDPSVEKSAAALSVAVGSYQEPKEFGGLAHYLEHMLFLGTKSYPTVGEYSDFVSKNGGSQNAYTQLDHTNYMVAVNNNAYEEALDRFSTFFYEAILDPTYADKERNAVHSEWTMKGPNDWVILGQLDGLTLNPDHPISQFNWGNLDSLQDHGDNNKLQDALVKLYNTYYSANLMKASMISDRPIKEMKTLANAYFGRITNKNTPRPQINAPVAKPEMLNKVVHYVPQTDMKQLRLSFVIDNNADEFAVKPNGYVRYLINSEMPGTVAALLREQGLSENLWASFDADEYDNAGSFTIYVNLTEKGVNNRDQVMAAILKYLNLLRTQGVDEKYFAEIKQNLNNNFRFKEKVNDYRYAMQIAASMQTLPTEYVLSSGYEYQRFHPQAVQNVLDQLTLDNARVFYIDKEQPHDTGMTFFEGQYKVADIDAELKKKWQQLGQSLSLSLPRSNSLMPENFELAKAEHTQQPIELVNQPGYSLYLGHSANFEQPKGRIILDLNSGLGKSSARHHVMANILRQGLYQHLLELSSEASSAGMGLWVSLYNGLSLTANGFSDKQGELLSKAIEQVLDYQMSDAELVNYKAAYRSQMASKKKQILLNQLFPAFNKLINLDEFSDEALLAEVDDIKVSDINRFRDQLLKQANLRVFAFGNYTQAKAKEMADMLIAQLPAERKAGDVYLTPTLKPQAGESYDWREDVQMTDIGLVDAYMTKRTDKDIATGRVLTQILRPALFKQIRTEEQLAYAVGFFTSAMREQLLAGYYIQSPAKGPGDIAERINAFRASFPEKLNEMSQEEFETVRNSVLITLTQPPKNLSEEMGHFQGDWRNLRLDFNSKAKLIAAVKTVTLDDVKNLYQRIEGQQGFGRVMLQMRGTKFSEADYANPANASLVSDIDAFHQSMK